MTNRPEFHIFDSAALHLGATPFSIYNTYTPEQIQYQVGDEDAPPASPSAPFSRASSSSMRSTT